MNSKDFYSAINEIDDDLIENAMVVKPKNNTIFFKRILPIAACFCFSIIGVAMSNMNSSDTGIYINEVDGLLFKSDMVTEIPIEKQLSFDEIQQYFNPFIVPREIDNNLRLVESDNYSIFINKDNSIYDDSITFEYSNGKDNLQLTLSKKGIDFGDTFYGNENIKSSKINDLSVNIGVFTDYKVEEQDLTEIKKYIAEFERDNIYFTVIYDGANENDFIEILRKL